ncbi:MAG TPA: diaminopimelate epimerase [Polyangiaceae bacterium]|nr:diaminopimelate epimerase [Polyangiaceae bacterium]
MALRFGKYEGIGNDFLVVEAQTDTALAPEQARKLCDRHYGVGGDGVLLSAPPITPGAHGRMVVLNSDGSRPEGCGNGLRCVALSLARKTGQARTELLIDTDAGPRNALVELQGDRADVTVSMGKASREGEVRAQLRGEELTFQRISMGNPHAIVFDVAVSEAELDELGPSVSKSLAGGTNVEFVRATGPASFDVLVWERGVGRTLACGTGAAAVAALAALLGRAPYDAPITLRLPGGPLQLTVRREDLAVTLRGPARFVFSGEVPDP